MKLAYADEPTPPASESAATSTDDTIRNITIEMESLSFKPTSVSVTAGETVRFVLKNIGDIPHEFTIGTPLVQSGRRAVMRELFDADILQEYLADAPEREGPNSVVILGGETRELIWTFTETQDIEFGCNLPLHYEAGMRGDIHVHVPPKSNAVAAHEHNDGSHEHSKHSGGTSTNGLANLAQLMAKAKEAVNGDVDAEQASDSDSTGKSEEVATSDASEAATPGNTPDAPSAATTTAATTAAAGTASEVSTSQTEASAPGETATDNEEGDNTEGEQTEGGQSEEDKGTVKSTPPVSATVPVAVRAPEYRAFDRGLALMSNGDILGARVEFEKSATAESALALGRSYDEKYLSRIENPNAQADAVTARQWYEAWYRISVRQGAISAETNLDLLIKAMTNE